MAERTGGKDRQRDGNAAWHCDDPAAIKIGIGGHGGDPYDQVEFHVRGKTVHRRTR